MNKQVVMVNSGNRDLKKSYKLDSQNGGKFTLGRWVIPATTDVPYLLEILQK